MLSFFLAYHKKLNALYAWSDHGILGVLQSLKGCVIK